MKNSIRLSEQRCLVLGGSGFIGTNLCVALRGKVKSLKSFSRHSVDMDGVEWVGGDFFNDADIKSAVSGVDTVFHLISASTPASSNEDPLKDAQQNILQTIKLLEACRKSSVSRIIFISSGGTVYGEPALLPTPEAHLENPICAYGVSKLAIEKYLQLYERLHDLPSIILRVSNPYGPYQHSRKMQGVIGSFISKAFNGEPIEIWGNGEVTRDYVYIEDVVDAIIKAAVYEGGYRVFNIGSGRGATINEIASFISSSMMADLKISHKESRTVDVSKSILDCTLAESELRWMAKQNLKTGIALTVSWFKESLRYESGNLLNR